MFTLLAEGTVDEVVFRRAKRKLRLSRDILSDPSGLDGGSSSWEEIKARMGSRKDFERVISEWVSEIGKEAFLEKLAGEDIESLLENVRSVS